MSGEKPGKPRGALFLFGSLGAAFLFSAGFLFVTGQLAAEQSLRDASRKSGAVDEGAAGAETPAFSLRIKKDVDRIKLKGTMPSEEDHKTLLGLVKANFASVYIKDRVKSAKGTARTNVKVGSVNFALKVLSCLETGTANVDSDKVTLGGVAATSALYEEAWDRVDKGRPTGVHVEISGIKPPSEAPTWTAIYSNGHLSMTGVVPDEGKKKVLETAARELFGQASYVRTGVVETTPDNWMAAALHSLQLLRNLERGTVEITDQSIRVEGKAADETVLKTVDKLADKYPRGFALNSKVVTEKHATEPTYQSPGED